MLNPPGDVDNLGGDCLWAALVVASTCDSLNTFPVRLVSHRRSDASLHVSPHSIITNQSH